MIARGPAARPTSTAPAFSARLSKVTGEGEQLEVAFTATSPDELAARLAAAGAAATARLTTNNDAIAHAADTLEARTQRVYDAAVAQLRHELGLGAVTATGGRRPTDEPPDEHEPPDDEPAEGDEPADEEPDAHAAAGAVHTAANP